MIGRVAGVLVHRGPDHVVIDARGVGYVVHVSERTLAALPGLGEAAALWTELLVREDALTLVGFTTLVEKEWHRLLMTVQGVGSKAAMSILGTLGAEALSALAHLGYAPSEAAAAVAQASGESPGAETPALIRAALRLLAPKG